MWDNSIMSKKGDAAAEKASTDKKASPRISPAKSKPGERAGNLRRRAEWFQRRSGAPKS